MSSADLAPVAITFMGLGVLAMMVNGRKHGGFGERVMQACFATSVGIALVAIWLP